MFGRMVGDTDERRGSCVLAPFFRLPSPWFRPVMRFYFGILDGILFGAPSVFLKFLMFGLRSSPVMLEVYVGWEVSFSPVVDVCECVSCVCRKPTLSCPFGMVRLWCGLTVGSKLLVLPFDAVRDGTSAVERCRVCWLPG